MMHTADNAEQQGTPTPRTNTLSNRVNALWDIGAADEAVDAALDECAKLERELIAKTAEAERLREALEAFMRLRTDAPGFAVAFTAACLGADKALAARVQIEKEKNANG